MGENVSESTMVDVIIDCKFDMERALDRLLKDSGWSTCLSIVIQSQS